MDGLEIVVRWGAEMKALILAGGEGTRLRPLTLNTPKPIVPIITIPILRYQIELLRQHGIKEIILSLSYQPRLIEQVLGDGSSFGVRLDYIVEPTPLGTAGAFKNAESLLYTATMVFNGDILCELNLTEVMFTIWSKLFRWPEDTGISVEASWICVGVVCATCLWLLVRRVRAFEVVK